MAKDVTPVCGDLLDHFQRSQRPQESNENLLPAQKRKIRRAGDIVGAIAQDLDNNICRAETRRPGQGESLRPFRRIAGPGNPLPPPRRLDHNFKARLYQTRHDHGNQSHAPLTGITFSRNADNHKVVSFLVEALNIAVTINNPLANPAEPGLLFGGRRPEMRHSSSESLWSTLRLFFRSDSSSRSLGLPNPYVDDPS